jgi:predicted Zn finger-like uncharacterized protein
MLIVCPNCGTSYQVEPNSLGQGGRSVRCARCRNVWFATIPSLVSTLPGSNEWDVIDTGPRVPSVDGRLEPAVVVPEPPAADVAPPADIDVPGLSADIEAERAGQAAEADAVLAEFVQESAAVDSPSLVPAQSAASPAAQPPAAGNDPIEIFAARRARRDASRHSGWRRSGLPSAILILVAVNAGFITWRMDIVRLLPQTAAIYAAIGLPVNLRGLAFEDIRMSRVEQDGVGVLVVEGSIVNVTNRVVEVPRLRVALRNESKREIYAWTAQPSRSILEPGDALPFRSRLASPPADAREVQVRFFNKRDLVAGLN